MNTQPQETPDFTACPHWGKGGRYVVNGEGQRVPQENAGAAEPEKPVVTETVSQTSPKKGR